MKNISQRQAESIARKQFLIETLTPRNRDSLDFHEVSVRAVRDALNEAFLAGQREAAKVSPSDNYSVITISDNETIEVMPGSLRSTVDRGPKNRPYNGAVEGVESLILALASEGIDMRSPKIHKAVKTTFEALANNLDD